jgi:hypothetical protein
LSNPSVEKLAVPSPIINITEFMIIPLSPLDLVEFPLFSGFA